MAKTLLYRLFGLGSIPKQFAETLKAEGVLLLDEGVPGSVTYLDFRAPGRRANWRRQWFTASVVLTQFRLVAFQYSKTSINVPFTDERLRRMQFAREGEGEEGGTLVVRFDPALFHSDWSGTMEYRFRTSQAKAFLEMLRERQGTE